MTTTQTPSIVLLTGNDAEQYRHLRLKALLTNPQSFLSTFEVEQQKPLDAFRYELSYSYQPPIWGYYGLWLDSHTLIGFCQISRSTLAKQTHIAFLYNLYIDPKHRLQHYGQSLLDHVVAAMHKEEIEKLFISHIKSNTIAHQFYLHYGFQLWGIRPHSVKTQQEYDDEVEMVLNLPTTQ